MTVGQLLEQARAAHLRYRQVAGRIGQKGKVTQQPDLLAAGAAIQQALGLRTEAHALDPAHADLAWVDDARLMRAEHDALVAFYVKYLAPPEAFAQEPPAA